eukprot:TRINITY_DN503_c0_g2_i2.p1 TRINITY_DN503_c0_g2~~TRINITY_DN503_c0_g2_i2.p1  ORF type:complete len:259 (-),score=21.59 TRINITY_DN503_c0_g2_i2:133-834(-)
MEKVKSMWKSHPYLTVGGAILLGLIPFSYLRHMKVAKLIKTAKLPAHTIYYKEINQYNTKMYRRMHRENEVLTALPELFKAGKVSDYSLEYEPTNPLSQMGRRRFLIGGYVEMPDEAIKTAMKNLGVQEKEINESDVLEITISMKDKDIDKLLMYKIQLQTKYMTTFIRGTAKVMKSTNLYSPIGRIQKGDEVKLFIPFPEDVGKFPTPSAKAKNAPEEPKGTCKKESKTKEK